MKNYFGLKRPNRFNKKDKREECVSSLISYIFVTSIIMIIAVILMINANTVFIDNPSNRITYYSFIDIANGVSTRIIDIYAIAPATGTIDSSFDIPDEIAGRDYYVTIANVPSHYGTTKMVQISRDNIMVNISLAGVNETKRTTGSTTGSGVNMIKYDSSRE